MILLKQPQWWTMTAKAIVIVGIAMTLQFMHSFGLVHGNLKPNNIFIDEDLRIQITDMSETEFIAPEGQQGRERTEKMDIFAFAGILRSIIVEQPDIHRRFMTIPGFVPEFVSRLIESGLSIDPNQRPSFGEVIEAFERNTFMIDEGVDCDIVSSFLSHLKLSEPFFESKNDNC
jgi:serine/threonine protein kinase